MEVMDRTPTEEEGGLAHGLEAAAAVLVDGAVPRRQDDQHALVGQLLTTRHRRLKDAAASGRDHLGEGREMGEGFVCLIGVFN